MIVSYAVSDINNKTPSYPRGKKIKIKENKWQQANKQQETTEESLEKGPT